MAEWHGHYHLVQIVAGEPHPEELVAFQTRLAMGYQVTSAVPVQIDGSTTRALFTFLQKEEGGYIRPNAHRVRIVRLHYPGRPVIDSNVEISLMDIVRDQQGGLREVFSLPLDVAGTTKAILYVLQEPLAG